MQTRDRRSASERVANANHHRRRYQKKDDGDQEAEQDADDAATGLCRIRHGVEGERYDEQQKDQEQEREEPLVPAVALHPLP